MCWHSDPRCAFYGQDMLSHGTITRQEVISIVLRICVAFLEQVLRALRLGNSRSPELAGLAKVRMFRV
jgi:hypothetical protein